MSDAPQTPNEGLSDDAASGLAYITIIPSIIFLLVAPYNTKPIVKFHSLQNLGLAVAWFALFFVRIIVHFIPFIGWILGMCIWLCYLAIFILWLISMLNAFQGKRFNIPLISDFAAKTAGL